MIKLFTAQQIRDWDNYTINHEPISSLNLMERASKSFADWFTKHYTNKKTVYIFCGPGNNGGDGLAISRLLQNKNYTVSPFLVSSSSKLSKDCQTNYNRIKNNVTLIQNEEMIHSLQIAKDVIIIDALFGSGLTKPLEGIYKLLVKKLNSVNNHKIAIDIPSGMYCDKVNNSNEVIFKTDNITSFQIPKRSFFLEKNQSFFSSYTVLNIGLSDEYYEKTKCDWQLVNREEFNNLNHDKKITNHKTISLNEQEYILILH